jgi:hypothetical protein
MLCHNRPILRQKESGDPISYELNIGGGHWLHSQLERDSEGEMKMDKGKLDMLWKTVESVMDYKRMEYDESVTLGSVFGQMKSEIEEQVEKIEKIKLLADSNFSVEPKGTSEEILMEILKITKKEMD